MTADTGRHDQVKPRSCTGMLNMHIDTYGDVVHTKMAGNTERHISIHPIDLEQPDSPTWSTRQHADLLNKPEGHANIPNMHRNAHGNVNGSNTPENESVTPDSPVRGTVSCITSVNPLRRPIRYIYFYKCIHLIGLHVLGIPDPWCMLGFCQNIHGISPVLPN